MENMIRSPERLSERAKGSSNIIHDKPLFNNTLFIVNGTTLIRYIGTSIDAAVKIPEGITKIAADAFSGSNVGSVTFPEGVTLIGNKAFKECNKLQEIQLPESLQRIGMLAFWNCKSLKRITVPDNVKSIEVGAFFGCTSLTEIIMSPELMPELGIYSLPGSCNVKSSGQTKSDWITSGTKLIRYIGKVPDATVKIPGGITVIAVNAFSVSTVGSVTLPEGVTTIGNEAFMGCNKLQEIQLPESLQRIGMLAFWNCKSLKRITIPDNVKSIGVSTFLGCSSLTEIIMSPELMPESGNYGLPVSCEIRSTQDIADKNDIYNCRSHRSNNSLLEYLNQFSIKIEDKRQKGRALWITGDEQSIQTAIQKTMEIFGAKWAYSKKRGSYYTRCKK